MPVNLSSSTLPCGPQALSKCALELPHRLVMVEMTTLMVEMGEMERGAQSRPGSGWRMDLRDGGVGRTRESAERLQMGAVRAPKC